MDKNENDLGYVAELNISDIMKRAYFQIPNGEVDIVYRSSKAFYDSDGFYMYDAYDKKHYIDKRWLVLQKSGL